MSISEGASERTQEGHEDQSNSGANDSNGQEVALPPYDPAAVGRIAARVEIQAVELVGAHFTREDDSPLPVAPSVGELTPDIGIGVAWSVSDDGLTFGCLLSFSASFEADPAPYEVFAGFRLAYTVSEGERPADEDFELFAHWNAVFNAWPYWREYLSSTLNRAQLPRFVVPVLGVPRAAE